ncbi:LysR family transcriptional regulator [Azospirillum sp. A39]|uniref:LysR family transcriptional regulator n=1 Tax=Azospirillum sp. A39 TaxID=3462279 RepID=UPI0040463EFB
MRDLNLDHLRAFAWVVEAGSFSAAADRLNLTQPAVSLQVRQLERRLGVRLVERIGRRAQPTAAGADLLHHVRRIDEAVAGAVAAMDAHRSGVAGRVRLATGATACTYLLPPILGALRRAMPTLDVVVSTGNTPDVLRSVEENSADAALVTLPAPGRMFQVTPVYQDELVAVFPTATAPADPGPVGPDVLCGRPLVLYEPGGHTRRVIDDWFMAAGFPVKAIMELGNVEAIKELVAVELGCSVLPRLCVTGNGLRPGLAVRSLAPGIHRTLGVVVRRDKSLDRALRELLRSLTQLG